MTVLNKQNIPRPTLPKETVTVAELGGDVVVQALLLKDQLELSLSNGSAFGRVSQVLATTVLDNDNKPIFSVEEWEIWGSLNTDSALSLFNVAKRLSGMSGDEKKDTAQS